MKHIYFIVSIILFASLAFILAAQHSEAALITLNNCVNLTNSTANSSNSYVLNTLINNNGANPCFNMTNVSNIDFYCNSRASFIEGNNNDGVPETSAVAIYHSNNITFRDCNITKWDNHFYLLNITNINITNISAYRSLDYDVFGQDTINLTIEKSIFKDSIGGSYAFYLSVYLFSQNNYTTLKENTIYGLENGAHSLEFDSQYNGIINNNTIYQNSTDAIYVANGNGNVISNNTFLECYCGVGTSTPAINIVENSVTVLSNNMTGCKQGNSHEYGIYLNSDYNIIKNNIVRNYSKNLLVDEGAQGNYIENLNSSDGTNGILFQSTGGTIPSDNLIRFSNIKNNTYGIYFTDTGGAGTITSNFIQDSNISNSEISDVYYNLDANPGNINNSFLNTTFYSPNISITTPTEDIAFMYKQWYLDVQVVYDNGSYAASVNVNITNTKGENITLATDATGWIDRQNITEYYITNNTDGNSIEYPYYYLGNATKIHAYKNPENSTSVNFTESKNTFVNLTLSGTEADTTQPLITIQSPSNTTYSAGTTSLSFNASINEEGSWCGFSLDGADNVTMTEFNITYFNYSKTSLTAGAYSLTFSCNDTSNNFNATSIVFQIASTTTTITPGDGGYGSSGGGGIALKNITNISEIKEPEKEKEEEEKESIAEIKKTAWLWWIIIIIIALIAVYVIYDFIHRHNLKRKKINWKRRRWRRRRSAARKTKL